MRQQVVQREARAHARKPRDMDRRRRVGEFADVLAATAAGRAKPLAIADDENFRDAPPPGARHRRDRAGLGASALGIGGVLDVAAGKDLAVRRPDRGADLKFE